MTLTADDLAIIDRNLNRRLEPTTIDLLIGSSSEDIRLKGELINY